MPHATLIARQRAYFHSGATASCGFRRVMLKELQNGILSREVDLLEALHADLRKNPHEAYASEIGYVLGELRHAIRELPRWMRPSRRRAPFAAWPSSAELRREAYGVSLIIGPWNYPLQLLLAPLVGALAAGNTAILKPSEFAPHTAEVIASLIRQRFDENYLAVVQGARECSEALLCEKFDKIFFTGGTSTGRAVMAAAARHLTPVTLELGGKCPCVVTADAPIVITARRIVWGKFINAGQTCVAPDHLWVERRCAAALLDAMRAEIRNFYGEDPMESADYGRIINERHFERLVAMLSEGRVLHGGRTDLERLYIEPTILTEVKPGSTVMRDEIFGPILPVLLFDDLTEVLASMRGLPPPLAFYLFCADREVQELMLAGTRSGGVCINDTISHIIGNDLPFGGVGESGMGTYHGRASFECFSHPRAVLRRSLVVDPSFRYPPPKAPLATLKRVMRYFS